MVLNSGTSKNVCVHPLGYSCIFAGEFYGKNPREANLELLVRFFEKYPSYADKAFLSVKVRLSGILMLN